MHKIANKKAVARATLQMYACSCGCGCSCDTDYSIERAMTETGRYTSNKNQRNTYK